MSLAMILSPLSITVCTWQEIDIQSQLMEPPVPGFEYMPDVPSWSFLVESSTTGKKALFDLGVPPDWETFSPIVSDQLKERGWEIYAEKHTSQILEENGVDLKEIGSIVWRYVSSVDASKSCYRFWIGGTD
jgi:hypothetical protein